MSRNGTQASLPMTEKMRMKCFLHRSVLASYPNICRNYQTKYSIFCDLRPHGGIPFTATTTLSSQIQTFVLRQEHSFLSLNIQVGGMPNNAFPILEKTLTKSFAHSTIDDHYPLAIGSSPSSCLSLARQLLHFRHLVPSLPLRSCHEPRFLPLTLRLLTLFI